MHSAFKISNLFNIFGRLYFFKSELKFLDGPSVQFRTEMSQLKEASYYTFLYQTSRCLHEGNKEIYPQELSKSIL